MDHDGNVGSRVFHECPIRSEHRNSVHGPPEEELPAALYGPAITTIERRDGAWWAHNEEYSTEISFCPWCGSRLDKEVGITVSTLIEKSGALRGFNIS